MSDDGHTDFKFEYQGVRIEISGERDFVDQLYRRIMSDLDEAKRRLEAPSGAFEELPPASRHTMWVVRCTEMMQRIFMADSRDLEASTLSNVLDGQHIGTLYLDKESLSRLLPEVEDREETLWALLTDEGRRKLASGKQTEPSE